MRKGEVWRVRLPMLPGHVQGGERLTVIVQNDAFIASLPTVWVVPFTSKTAAARFPGTVLVQPDGRNGLTTPGLAILAGLEADDELVDGAWLVAGGLVGGDDLEGSGHGECLRHVFVLARLDHYTGS